MGIRVIHPGGINIQKGRRIGENRSKSEFIGNLHVKFYGRKVGAGGRVSVYRRSLGGGIFNEEGVMADYYLEPGQRAGHGTERPLPAGLIVEGY